MEEYFIMATAGIFAFFFLFVVIYGGRRTAGLIGSVISGIALLVIFGSWYSGMLMFSSQVSTTTGTAHKLALASLKANNFNGEIAMLIFAVLFIAGVMLYVIKSKKEVKLNE